MTTSLLLALFLILPFIAAAADVGHYRYTFGPLSVYDVTLDSPDGIYSPQAPFQLIQTYRMGVAGSRISSGALREWKKQGYAKNQIAAWAPQLKIFMPDVENGDIIRSVHTIRGGVEVYKNDQLLGGSQNPEFASAYFNLWLGPNSTSPTQRNALIGGSQ